MANALAARAEREGVGNEVAGAAARAWIELWLARQRVDLLDQRVASVTELLAQLERMAQSGMVDAATVDSARRQLVDIELERARLDQGRITTEAQFRQYFRAVPTGAPALQEIIDAETASSLVSSWETAPDVKRAGAELLAARADLARQEAALRPRASIQSGVNSPVKENDPTDITLGLTLEYQISTGGRRRAEIEAARERVDLAENRLRETRDNLVAELDGLAAQLDMMAASIRLAEERSRLAEAEVSAARSQLVTGQSNLRALIDAEIASYRANDQRLSAQAAKLGMQLSIAARTGALTARLGIGQPAGAPDAE
jgi:outer membrane protein TolC